MNGGVNETIEREKMRERGRGGIKNKLFRFSHRSRFKEATFKLFKNLIGPLRGDAFPKITKRSGKLRGGGKPSGDRGASGTGGPIIIDHVYGKMIRERSRVMLVNLVVRGVRRDRDSGGDKGIIKERKRKKETIDTRGPGIGGRRVFSNVKKGVIIMWGVIDFKMSLEVGPKVTKEAGGKGGARRGGVREMFNEIKVTTDKGINIIGDREKKRKKDLVEMEVSRLQVEVEDLEGEMGNRFRSVSPHLGVTPNKTRQGEIISNIKVSKRRGVYNRSACLGHVKIIPRD